MGEDEESGMSETLRLVIQAPTSIAIAATNTECCSARKGLASSHVGRRLGNSEPGEEGTEYHRGAFGEAGDKRQNNKKSTNMHMQFSFDPIAGLTTHYLVLLQCHAVHVYDSPTVATPITQQH